MNDDRDREVSSETAPVLQDKQGRHIPWEVHRQAWVQYHKTHPGQTAARIAERGGFSAEELDEYAPGWRAFARARTE